jgi:hypothetical protein
MIDHDRIQLVAHPVVQAMVNWRWRNHARALFMRQFANFALFVLLFSVSTITRASDFAVAASDSRELAAASAGLDGMGTAAGGGGGGSDGGSDGGGNDGGGGSSTEFTCSGGYIDCMGDISSSDKSGWFAPAADVLMLAAFLVQVRQEVKECTTYHTLTRYHTPQVKECTTCVSLLDYFLDLWNLLDLYMIVVVCLAFAAQLAHSPLYFAAVAAVCPVVWIKVWYSVCV